MEGYHRGSRFLVAIRNCTTIKTDQAEALVAQVRIGHESGLEWTFDQPFHIAVQEKTIDAMKKKIELILRLMRTTLGHTSVDGFTLAGSEEWRYLNPHKTGERDKFEQAWGCMVEVDTCAILGRPLTDAETEGLDRSVLSSDQEDTMTVCLDDIPPYLPKINPAQHLEYDSSQLVAGFTYHGRDIGVFRLDLPPKATQKTGDAPDVVRLMVVMNEDDWKQVKAKSLPTGALGDMMPFLAAASGLLDRGGIFRYSKILGHFWMSEALNDDSIFVYNDCAKAFGEFLLKQMRAKRVEETLCPEPHNVGK